MGTPPFSFTWSRTPLEDDRKKGKKNAAVDPEEATTVTDIDKHHVRVLSDLIC